MRWLPNLIFIFLLLFSLGFFVRNMLRLRRNIRLGIPFSQPLSHKGLRLKRMLLLAFGQTKLVRKPVAGALHLLVYFGFFVVNIEMLEIVLDGTLGTHRILSCFPVFYNFITAVFEGFALAVLVAVFLFWIRRNILKIKRLDSSDLRGFPKKDANIILYAEAFLMLVFLLMNAADLRLQQMGVPQYHAVGYFPVSQYVAHILPSSTSVLIGIERGAWWLHIAGVLLFLNYLYYSKHLHILLAFPYTYLSPLTPKGELENMPAVTREVALMMDENTAFTSEQETENQSVSFGASDVTALSRLQLLSAFACTECGRCTEQCPANQTGKKLSPRKIMMQVRRRAEEIGQSLDRGKEISAENQLLGNYISAEELWACTTCNACVEACPMEINPLSVIIEMRRYLVMEQSAAPASLNMMMTQMENSGSPWGYSPSDRENIFE